MARCYQVDLRVNDGHALLLVFSAMKKMQQETSLIDESTAISYDDFIKLTAGFYDDFEIFYDLFIAVIWKDMEQIKMHLMNEFPSDLDSEIRQLAVDNICESLQREHKNLSKEEKEELYKLAGTKNRIK